MPVEKRDRLKEAERLNKQSLNLWREKPEQALSTAREAMGIRREILGVENRDYVESLNNVARVYKVLAKYPRATGFYEEALEVRKRVLGEKHPDYAESLKNLAGLYYLMKDYDEASSLFKRAEQVRER